jgi:flavin reductase (DIM6/NTAB) family NADH-FMN oxidoreductase RutF
MIRTEINPFYFHYPSAATIVTSGAGEKVNAMAVAWHMAQSHNPPIYLVSISPRRFTHELLLESNEFVVNFMPHDMGWLVAAVAACSGNDIDKYSEFGIKSRPGSQVKAPVLDDAIASYECRVTERHTYGDHDLFVGDILAVQWEPSAFREDSIMDIDHNRPILYMGGDYYTAANDLVHLERTQPKSVV